MNRTSLRLITWGVVLCAVVAASLLLPVRPYAIKLIEYVRDAGPVGVAVYAGAYILATILFLPGSLLTLGAGFLYGVVGGALLVWPTSVAAASIAFVLGRGAARKRIERKIASYPRLHALDQAIADSDFLVITLLRLSPVVPFNLLNYFLGVTSARFTRYLAATTVGMVPGILLYVYLGSALTNLAELGSGQQAAGSAGTAVFVGGLIATLIVSVFLTQLAKRKLKAMEDETATE